MELKDLLKREDPKLFDEVDDQMLEWENSRLKTRIEKFVTSGNVQCAICDSHFDKGQKRVRKKGVMQICASDRSKSVAFNLTVCGACNRKYFKGNEKNIEEIKITEEAKQCGFCDKFVFHSNFVRGIVIKYYTKGKRGSYVGKLVKRKKVIQVYFCDEKCMNEWEAENERYNGRKRSEAKKLQSKL